MFCYQCGEEIKDNMDFCPYCGSNLKIHEKKQETEQKEAERSSRERMANDYYAKGIGIAISEKRRAGIYLEKAAEMGHAGAIAALGCNLAFGTYVVNNYKDTDYSIPKKEDLLEAKEKFKTAYEKGNYAAKRHLLEMYLSSAYGDYTENIFGYNIEQVEKLGKSWIKRAETTEEKKYALDFFCDRFLQELSLNKVLTYIEELINIDEKENYRLGKLYFEGYDDLMGNVLKPDLDLAEKYMILAKEAGNVNAVLGLFDVHNEMDRLEDNDIVSLRKTAHLYMHHNNSFDRNLAQVFATCGKCCILISDEEDNSIEEGLECLEYYVKHLINAPNKTLEEEEEIIDSIKMIIETYEGMGENDKKNKYIELLNTKIKLFSLATRASYIDAFWEGNEIFTKNRDYVKVILKETFPEKLKGISFEKYGQIHYFIIDFYARNKYKIDEEVKNLIDQVFDKKTDVKLKEHKELLLTMSKYDKLYGEKLQLINNIEEQAHTVNGIRYESKDEVESAEVEMEKIQKFYKESKENDIQKYRYLISQNFSTEAAQKEVDKKTKELIEYVERLKESSKNDSVPQLEFSEVMPGLFWGIVGLIVFANFGGLIIKIIAIFCMFAGVYDIYDEVQKNKTNQENAKRYTEQCIQELAEFDKIFKIVDNQIVLRDNESNSVVLRK